MNGIKTACKCKREFISSMDNKENIAMFWLVTKELKYEANTTHCSTSMASEFAKQLTRYMQIPCESLKWKRKECSLQKFIQNKLSSKSVTIDACEASFRPWKLTKAKFR